MKTEVQTKKKKKKKKPGGAERSQDRLQLSVSAEANLVEKHQPAGLFINRHPVVAHKHAGPE